jgi:hypothetical protein
MSLGTARASACATLATPLDSAADLALFLASYARTARFRIEHGDFPVIAAIRSPFKGRHVA